MAAVDNSRYEGSVGNPDIPFDRTRPTAPPDTPDHSTGTGADQSRDRFTDSDRLGASTRMERSAFMMDSNLINSDSIAGDPWGIQKPIGGPADADPNPGTPE